MLLICKKLYADYIDESAFVDKDMLAHYAKKDFHRFYIVEIEKVLVKR